MALPAFREDGWLPAGHFTATWDEIIGTFGGEAGSRRHALTRQLLELREALLRLGMTGDFLLDGSYISAKPEPGDFDVLFIGRVDVQAVKDRNPALADLLDAERAEKERGYSLFYLPADSPALGTLTQLWDLAKDGSPKGVVPVSL